MLAKHQRYVNFASNGIAETLSGIVHPINIKPQSIYFKSRGLPIRQ